MSDLTMTHHEVMPAGFSQAVSVEANGVRTIHLSGQIGEGDTLAEQSKGAYASLAQQLENAGAKPSDVVKLVTYIVDYSPDKIAGAFAGFGALFPDREKVPAHTVVGVQALFQPQIEIEIEAVAVVASGD